MAVIQQLSYVQFLILLLLSFACTSSPELQWNEENGYKWAKVSPGYFGETGFSKLNAEQTEIDFANKVSDQNIRKNRNFLNGSGVALADVDGDGLTDIYFACLEGPNKMYKNTGGFEFKDITEEANLSHAGYHSTGVVFADVNGDHYPDLLVTSLTKQNELYINNGNGSFRHKEDSGLGDSKGSNTMALADIDNDGDLDLYISNFKLKTVRDIYSAKELSTKNTVQKQGDSLVVVAPFDQYYGIIKTDGQSYRNEYGAKDELYINEGDGTFQKADDRNYFFNADGSERGLSPDWGLTAKFQDINDDGYPDLYVANDFWTPDRTWINQQDGTFRAIQREAIKSMSFAAMGVDFSDINRDGDIDFFVTEMLSKEHQRRLRQYSEHLDPINGRPQYNKNSLYLNRGDNTFAEISNYAQVPATEWSWATNFLDIDFDGYEDILIATGYGYDYQDIDTQISLNRQGMQQRTGGSAVVNYPSLSLRNIMLRNNRDHTFSDKSKQWGFEEKDISLGLAISDLDNDGDPDFVMNRFNEKAVVYENNSTRDRIAVRLNGPKENVHAVGAKLALSGYKNITQTKEIAAGGSYVSGSDYEAFFAAEAGENHSLTVTWPGGNSTTTIDHLKANRVYIVDYTDEKVVENKTNNEGSGSTLFKDISTKISHTHHEDSYNDFNVQPMLPFKVSRLGPGVSWFDYDRDGRDDLLIASGKGEGVSVFRNSEENTFEEFTDESLTKISSGDQTSILGWESDNEINLLVGKENFEQGDANVPSAHHYTIKNGAVVDKQDLRGTLSTTGAMAAADYNGNGKVDLLMGGRFKPGQYPAAASSRLFTSEEKGFILDKRNSYKLIDFGLVTGAVFTDFDSDGDPDLLLSREWDNLALLENKEGIFYNISSEVGLDSLKGWWNGVATGDFNSDGRPDIIATNIGKNSSYQLTDNKPLKLFFEDFNSDGKTDIIDTYFNDDLNAYVPRRKLYEFNSLPLILQYVESHEEYAHSSVSNIFGKNFDIVPNKEVNTVEHTIFMNTDEGFEATPLPMEAQLSTAYHPAIADFDNDGNEDLFLSQNLFSIPKSIPRQDAGRGLLLKGDGNGAFESISGHKSGIKIYGEQRGAAVSDFNKDGRSDLVVSQNKGQTKLFENTSPAQGLRVRLVGPDKNKDAIGSKIQAIYADGTQSPIRELQAGSGYWSQRSFVQVFGKREEIEQLQVNWFNGKESIIEVVSDENEKIITYSNLFN